MNDRRKITRSRLAGLLLALTLSGLVLQCDFMGSRVVMPSWHITLTVPLVDESYPLSGLLSSDTTNTIRVYGDSVDTNSDGTYDILLPDTLAGYPGGLYIGLENDLPPITLPQDLFVIPGQDPIAVNVGPIVIGPLLPAELDSGVHPEAVDTTIGMAEMGLNIGSIIIDNIPAADCEHLDSTRSDTINFTFGAAPQHINSDQDVRIPGFTKTIEGSYPSDTDNGCFDCGTGIFICDTAVTYEYTDFIAIPHTDLPTLRQGFELLPSPDVLPEGTPLEGFESVTISTGRIQSILNSQMPLTASDAGLIVYTKKANGDTTHLHNHFYSSISPYMMDGEDSIRISALDGVQLYDSLIVEFGGRIDAATRDTLLFPRGVTPFFHYNFEIDIDGFESIQVVMGDTTIVTQEPLNTETTDESGQTFSVEIVSATFEDNLNEPDTNRLEISVGNDLGVDIIIFEIALKNFYESPAAYEAGTSQVIRFPIEAGETKDTTVVLDGHIISNRTGDEQPIDSLDIETSISFDSEDGIVTIDYPPPDELFMNVGVDMKPLRIHDLTGLFDISFEVSEQQQPLSLPGLVGGITFGEAILFLTLDNEFGVHPGLGLDVKGYRGNDSVIVSLNPDSVTFEPGTAGDPVSTEIRISREHVIKTVDSTSEVVQSFAGQENIVDLMGLFPERVSVGGDAQISPNGLSSITAGAEIAGTWRFEIPFLLQVDAGGVEFLPPNFTFMAELDSSTKDNLVGSNGVPDASDMLISSKINTIISNDIGLGFTLEILVSDLPYFPFFSNQEQRAIVSADLDLDGTADTVDLNLDTLIMHPVVPTMRLSVPAGIPDPLTGLVNPGNEGMGMFEYSADFNLNESNLDTLGSFIRTEFAFLDTFPIVRTSGTFLTVEEALDSAGIAAPTVGDSLYILELSETGDELNLIYTVSPFGELGWLVEDNDHYIATKFIIGETVNPALLDFQAGVDVTAFMEFILNSEPLVSADEDSTE